jgi:hypothetical protein
MGGHFNFDGDKLKTNIQVSFQKVFSEQSIARAIRKIRSEVQVTAFSGWNRAIPFFFSQISWLDKTRLFFESHVLAIFTKLICH